MDTIEAPADDPYLACVIASPFANLVGNVVDASSVNENHGGVVLAAHNLGLFIFTNSLGGFNVEQQKSIPSPEANQGTTYIVDRVVIGRDGIQSVVRRTSKELIGRRGERSYQISETTLPPAEDESDELGIVDELTEKLNAILHVKSA